MSEGALTLENYVIVTRGTGRYYMTKQRADNIFMLLNSADRPHMIDIDDNYVATSDIVGIVSATQIDDMEKRKRGLWQCGKGNWHNRDEVCKCGWGMPSETDKKPEPTPEQTERSQLLIQLIKKKMFPKNVEKLSNAELRKMLQ